MLQHLSITIYISISFTTLAIAGQITTDGSMGSAQTLTGHNYTIAQDLGTTVGNNLFHSFGTFNLSPGDVATFTGANTIQNVISRVTDGNPSSIDGTIQSQVGNANFFFINPAGMVFGQHAAVDVPSAFHASTANELRFADGTAYNLVTPKGSLTAAPPEAFGFLGATGDIVIEGSQLKFKEGAEVSFTGGSITSNNATIEVPRGSLRVYGNGDTVSNMPVNGEWSGGNGAITMNGGRWETSGDGGGDIWISGGEISVINGANINNNNNGSQNAAGLLRINAGTLTMNQSIIATYAISSGHSSKIVINVDDLIQILNGSVIGSFTVSSGNAGDVIVQSGSLIIDRQESNSINGIGSIANIGSTGNAGNVTVFVQHNMNILNGGGSISNGGGVTSSTVGNGNAGNVIVTVNGEMQILNGGTIVSETWAIGNAGSVTVTTNRLVIDGQGCSDHLTGILSGAEGNSSGKASTINVVVNGEIYILNGGAVASSATEESDANTVIITANRLIINRQGSQYSTGIASYAGTDTSGNAGAVIITVNGEMHILNGGQVSSSNLGQGNAGTVIITANRLIIDGQGSEYLTGISSGVAESNSSGNAGHIIVNVRDNILMVNGGGVTSENRGTGNAGTVNISAEQFLQLTDNSWISTTSKTGDGGDITITAPAMVLNNGQITTSVLGTGGNGGDITLNGSYLVLDTGFIQANTAGKDAKGGNIFINMDGLLSNGGVTHIGGWKHETFNTNSGRNVIQAAANARENYGSITFKNPNNDTAANIGANSNRLEPIKLATHPCEGTKGRFNFRRRGDVGLPNSGKDVIQPKQSLEIDNEDANLSPKLSGKTICMRK